MNSLTPRQALGERGEAIASHWLETLGYQVLTRNHRCRFGEVDIVADDAGCLCFVEVRTRAPSWVAPAETVDRAKRRRVVRAAEHYLLREGEALGPRPLRFDVVEVQLDFFGGLTMSLHRNAFDTGE